MTDAEVVAALEELTELQQIEANIERDRKMAEAQAIPPEVRAVLDEIADEFDPMLKQAQEKMTALQDEIKVAVLELRHSVKGVAMQAVYSKPRISWDTDKLDGYILAGHTEIAWMRNEGKPSVSLRVVAVDVKDMMPKRGG